MIKKLFYILYFIIQCTWGFLQTLVGLFFFIAHIRCPHNFYRGCIETHWNSKYSGLSLGLFIFTPQINHNAVRVHEYGHTFQSLVLGPLYVLPGIISICWGRISYFEHKRKEENLSYTTCFVEWQASKIGELVTGEKAVW